MNELCVKLKTQLELAYSMPFDVSMSMVDGEEQYVCCPHNEGEIFFTVTVYVHNQIRLVVDIIPQRNASGILNEISLADESKQKVFFQYIDLLKKEKAKVNFYVNGELMTDYGHWPSVWRYFSCKISYLPIPEFTDKEDLPSFLSKWMIHGVSLIFSLLTIEDIDDKEEVIENEGRGKEIKSIRYERSRINRAICLAHKGYSCSVCGFNFLEQYGVIGKDFIEVHHTTPVSKMGDNYKLDIDKDLVPVCSNCHSMLHRKDPPLTVDELKAMMIHSENEKNKPKKPSIKQRNAFVQQLLPHGSLLKDIEEDNEVRILIHNMMELYEGTTILRIITECQREFQQKYFSMKSNDWRHLITDYVRKITSNPNLHEDEVFRYYIA